MGKPMGFHTTQNDDDVANTVTATAEHCDGMTASMGGQIVVGKGELLVISPSLNEGEMRIKVFPDELGADAEGSEITSMGDEDVAVDELISGKALSTYAVDPGEYSVSATIPEESRADGTIVLSTVDREDYEEQSKALDVALSDVSKVVDGDAPPATDATEGVTKGVTKGAEEATKGSDEVAKKADE